MEIYLATENPDKLKDFQPLFRELGVKLQLIPKTIPIKEGEDSLIENASLKAVTHSQHFPEKVIMATDGGVQIPFLGDYWNHVLTRRLSGSDPSDKFSDRKRAETLLEIMKGAKSNHERRLTWEEAFVLAFNGEIIFKTVEQSSKGFLVRKIPSSFKETGYWLGYLWFSTEFNKTYMEMSQEEKIKHSGVKQNLLKKLKSFDFEKYI